MAQKPHPVRALVLGANGKLGNMICAVFGAQAAPRLAIHPVSRDGSVGLGWSVGQSPDLLPRVDAVVALWGVTPAHGTPLSENSGLALAAMDLGRRLGANRVLHCSSAAIYGPSDRPLHEEDTPAPASPYGAAKADMETVLRPPPEDDGPVPVILRIGNVAGAESLFAAMGRDGPVTLDRFSDGHGPDRSYIAPGDLAKVLEVLCTLPRSRLHRVYNVAAPRVTAMADIVRAAGRDLRWRPAPEGALRRVALDTARLAEVCPMPDHSSDASWLVADWQRWSGRG